MTALEINAENVFRTVIDQPEEVAAIFADLPTIDALAVAAQVLSLIHI